jgi:hypothetical protein
MYVYTIWCRERERERGGRGAGGWERLERERVRRD